ncbi:MAG TPA: hypothetical protein VFL62_12725 [Bradyrhizobium sp.]|uniref:hypothetical protein n=1 Tax=Bradyrhizobium sp. TaxID=376 RepID=UPI002D7FEB2B|nr:hypothetical protein [Bradyrhizobium sp.]HET7887084.1 hypothetical protein [Bradyrhizobium sp.]
MKLTALWLACVILLFAGLSASHAAMRISDDRGGRIGVYLDKYQGLRTSGETVIIDGYCASACTLVLGMVPRNKICVTPRASLGFHAAWDPDASGHQVVNPGATRMLYAMYPSSVRRWIKAQGGLKTQLILLRGEALMSMYRSCNLDMRTAEAGTRGATELGSRPW